MHGSRALVARIGWWVAYFAVIGVPLALAWRSLETAPTLATWYSIVTGLLAFSMLVVTVVLIARLPFVVSAFGIETALLMHRLAAVTLAVLVVAHIALVLGSDPRGLTILDLTDTTAAARAGVVSTLTLTAAVLLALWRKRRQPRYEGWRLVHVTLAAITFLAAFLHIWWLNHLRATTSIAVLFDVLAIVVVLVGLRRWVWLPLRARRRQYVVEEVAPGPSSSVTLVLRAHGHRGVPFHAGQFAWLKVSSSPFAFEEHPFSIASTAHTPHRKEFTIKALGDFTSALGQLTPGRRVYLDGPYGGFTIDGLEKSPGFVFIAGGVGLTPMLSMLRTLRDRGDQRRHHLVVGARSLDDLMLREEIAGLTTGLDVRVTEVIESPGENWTGETGRIDGRLLDRVLPRHARHYDYFLCGPPAMVTAVGQQLRELRIPAGRIHTERFEVV